MQYLFSSKESTYFLTGPKMGVYTTESGFSIDTCYRFTLLTKNIAGSTVNDMLT